MRLPRFWREGFIGMVLFPPLVCAFPRFQACVIQLATLRDDVIEAKVRGAGTMPFYPDHLYQGTLSPPGSMQQEGRERSRGSHRWSQRPDTDIRYMLAVLRTRWI